MHSFPHWLALIKGARSTSDVAQAGRTALLIELALLKWGFLTLRWSDQGCWTSHQLTSAAGSIPARAEGQAVRCTSLSTPLVALPPQSALGSVAPSSIAGLMLPSQPKINEGRFPSMGVSHPTSWCHLSHLTTTRSVKGVALRSFH